MNTSLSRSALDKADSCAFSFWLSYCAKIERYFALPKSDAMFQGSAFHKGCSHGLPGVNSYIGSVIKDVADLEYRQKWNDKILETRAMVRAYQKHVTPGGAFEKKFQFKPQHPKTREVLEDIVIKGWIDMIVSADQWDHKSTADAVKYYEGRTWVNQFLTYALAKKTITGVSWDAQVLGIIQKPKVPRVSKSAAMDYKDKLVERFTKKSKLDLDEVSLDLFMTLGYDRAEYPDDKAFWTTHLTKKRRNPGESDEDLLERIQFGKSKPWPVYIRPETPLEYEDRVLRYYNDNKDMILIKDVTQPIWAIEEHEREIYQQCLTVRQMLKNQCFPRQTKSCDHMIFGKCEMFNVCHCHALGNKPEVNDAGQLVIGEHIFQGKLHAPADSIVKLYKTLEGRKDVTERIENNTGTIRKNIEIKKESSSETNYPF